MEAELEWSSHKPRNSGNHQKLGEPRKDPLPRVFGGSIVLGTPWFQTSGLQNCERLYFCCGKHPSLWEFVPAALGDSYGWVAGRGAWWMGSPGWRAGEDEVGSRMQPAQTPSQEEVHSLTSRKRAQRPGRGCKWQSDNGRNLGSQCPQWNEWIHSRPLKIPHLQRREAGGTPGRPREHGAVREWTLQPPQWARERQTSLKDRLRANQCTANGRIGKVQGAAVQRWMLAD